MGTSGRSKKTKTLPDKPEFTIQEAAKILRRDERWLRLCAAAGRIVGAAKKGKSWFLSKDAVARVLAWPRKTGILGQRAAAEQRAAVTGKPVLTEMPAVALPAGISPAKLPKKTQRAYQQILRRKAMKRRPRKPVSDAPACDSVVRKIAAKAPSKKTSSKKPASN